MISLVSGRFGHNRVTNNRLMFMVFEEKIGTSCCYPCSLGLGEDAKSLGFSVPIFQAVIKQVLHRVLVTTEGDISCEFA